MRETFDGDEAEHILERAAARGASGRTVTRERLLAMAEELGITPEEVEAAAAEVEAEREEEELRREFVAGRRSGFWAHLIPFLAVNLMLLVINVLTGFGHPWFLYPLMGWGIGLASHAYAVLPAGGPQFEREYAEWRQKRVKSRRRRERRASKRADKSAQVTVTTEPARTTTAAPVSGGHVTGPRQQTEGAADVVRVGNR